MYICNAGGGGKCIVNIYTLALLVCIGGVYGEDLGIFIMYLLYVKIIHCVHKVIHDGL